MANWVQTSNAVAEFANVDLAFHAFVQGSGSAWNAEVVILAGGLMSGASFTLAGSPFATEAEAMTALQAALAGPSAPVPPTATIAGTVTYSGGS